MTLRDAVRTADNSIGAAAREAALVSADPDAEPIRRQTAFRRIVELEVGDTWLRRSRAVARDFGIDDVYLKFEGDNPTGTQKDRIAFAQVADALSGGFADVALATCGNYGVAVALAARLAGLRCHIFLPAAYHSKRLGEMERLGGIVYRPAGSYEEVVTLSSQRAAAEGWYDANPGGKNAELQIEAYAGLGRELVAELGRAPASCFVPVSNGTLLAGIYRGLLLGADAGAMNDGDRVRWLTSPLGAGGPKPPDAINAGVRMIAASSTAKNPIVHSFRRSLRECVDLDPAKIRETVVNEPLINWHSFDGQDALDALYASGGAAYNVSDERMRKMASYLAQKEALRVLPASTAGLVALVRRAEEGKLGEGVKVVVLTGRS